MGEVEEEVKWVRWKRRLDESHLTFAWLVHGRKWLSVV